MNAPDAGDQAAIERVYEGMTVLDREGDEVGTVSLVKMGDPGAVTTEGQTDRAGEGLWAAVRRGFGAAEPDVPPPLAARLLRSGFVKIDSGGPLTRDLYVPADEIAAVTGQTVHLTVTREQLMAET